MELINRIDNIEKFFIEKNLFLFQNGQVNKDLKYNKIKNFEIVNDEIILLDENQKILNIEEYPNIPKNYFYKLSSASNNYFILIDENSLDFETFQYSKEGIYSIVDKKIVFENSIIGDRIFKDYVINGIGQSTITVFSIRQKRVIFSFPLFSIGTWHDGTIEKPYQVSEFCDIYNNTLIATMTNGDILLLNIEDGKSYKLLKGTKIIDGLFQKDANSSVYIGLKFKTYIEIDVAKQEVIKQIDLEEYFKQTFNRSTLVPINTTIYQNGYIYFIADTNIVGIFDPNSMKVIDFYEFKFENKHTMLKGGKENLQVKDHSIYCLDNQNNLYTLNYAQLS